MSAPKYVSKHQEKIDKIAVLRSKLKDAEAKLAAIEEVFLVDKSVIQKRYQARKLVVRLREELKGWESV